MDSLDLIQTFREVAQRGSFAAAARATDMSPANVSKYIAQLEKRFGVRLFNRTTRQVSLTDAGQLLLERSGALLELIDLTADELHERATKPSGRLSVTAPHGMMLTQLPELLGNFMQRYPDVSVDLRVTNRVVDLLTEGFDVALRTGKPQDSSLIGRMIGHCPRYMLASPDYLARRGPLTHPRQLVEHRSITHRAWSEWLLRSESEDYRYLPDNAHMTDNLVYARECAIAGAGITLLPAFLVEDKVEKGALVQVLPEWNVEGNDLWLAYPSRKLNSPALMSYIEFAMQFDEVKRYYVGK